MLPQQKSGIASLLQEHKKTTFALQLIPLNAQMWLTFDHNNRDYTSCSIILGLYSFACVSLRATRRAF